MTEQEMRDKAVAWASARLERLFRVSHIKTKEEAEETARMMRLLTGKPYTYSRSTHHRAQYYLVHLETKKIYHRVQHDN